MARSIEEPPPSRPAYFWWLLANVLALCFAVVTWALCLHVFGNPEIPRNYEILRKLGRLPELKRYVMLDVPNGNALTPKELYKKFFGIDKERTERVNKLLMRNYLTNFERPLLLTYVEGDYQVEKVRELKPGDFISRGFVIRARALVKPNEFSPAAPYPVYIEYVFPTEETAAAARFKPGDIMAVRKSPNCAAITHVQKVSVEGDDALLLTVIPIAYGPYLIGDDATFRIEPPVILNPGAGFPIMEL